MFHETKMFQLWKLVLLCGLLPGTSSSLLDNLGKDVLRKLKSGLEKGLDNIDGTLKSESTTDDQWHLGACFPNTKPVLPKAASRGSSLLLLGCFSPVRLCATP